MRVNGTQKLTDSEIVNGKNGMHAALFQISLI